MSEKATCPICGLHSSNLYYTGVCTNRCGEKPHPTIEEFIEARIAEEELWANRRIAQRERDADEGKLTVRRWLIGDPYSLPDDPARVLRQCAALRAVVESAGGCSWCDTFDDERKAMLKTTAAIWSDHPDYQQEWAI